MIRFSRPIRHAFSSFRLARNLAGSETIHVQRVRLRKSRLKLSHVLTGATAFYGCFAVFRSTVLAPWIQALDESLGDDPTPNEADGTLDALHDDPFFIPMPFAIGAIPSKPFSADDPEWQEYLRISRDPKLRASIRRDLAAIVCRVSEASPIAARMGKGLRVNRWWLEIDYPYRPPPDFMQHGIVIDDGSIGWGMRQLDPNKAMLTQRIMWPSALYISTLTFAGSLLQQTVVDMLSLVGYETSRLGWGADPFSASSPMPANATMQKMRQQMKRQSTRRPDEIGEPEEALKQKSPSGANRAQSFSSAASQSDDGAEKGRFPGHDTFRSTLAAPLGAFRKKLTQTWKQTRDYPPRGSIAVSGLVELEARVATLIVDVMAYWDPKTRKFDSRSMRLVLRKMNLKRQAPLA